VQEALLIMKHTLFILVIKLKTVIICYYLVAKDENNLRRRTLIHFSKIFGGDMMPEYFIHPVIFLERY
jgi:hypothetical protein